MELRQIKPVLWSSQIQATIAFYTEKLCFQCVSFNEAWGWAALKRDQVEIMVTLPNQHYPFDKPNFTGSFYFDTVEVDILWEQFKNQVSIVYPIEDFDYGMREFAILDNNGYILQFGQDLSEINK